MLKTDVKCENIIRYPYVNLAGKNKTFKEFATDCSRTIGGSPDEWMKQNKNILGFFGSKNKHLHRNTSFKIPDYLVTEATERFFESLGAKKRDPSPSVSPEEMTKPTDLNDVV